MPLYCKQTSISSLRRLGLGVSVPSRMTFLVVVEMAITDSLEDVAVRRAAGTTGGALLG